MALEDSSLLTLSLFANKPKLGETAKPFNLPILQDLYKIKEK